MKKILLTVIAFLFLATTFQSDNPPGWYLQTLPVNKEINDIYFTDSLNGWAATSVVPYNIDSTGYILHTSNGGDDWTIQFQERRSFQKIQFVNKDTGYAYGIYGFGYLYKTTNTGANWILLNSSPPGLGTDMFFINRDTGWICSDAPIVGGLAKTTNGGNSFFWQLNESFNPSKIFFINRDIGWVIGNNSELFKSNNGGSNWNLLNNFGNDGIGAIFFVSIDTGFLSGGGGIGSIKKTTNGGLNWFETNNSKGGKDIYFINSKTGWLCDIFSTLQKTTDAGLNWFNQYPPQGYYYSVQFIDINRGWSAGTNIIKTTDGGGPTSVMDNESTIPSSFILFQNYPNPFNPNTIIKYQITSFSKVVLKVYDVNGVEISELINENQSAGVYEYTFDGSELSSGVYFYRLEAISDDSHYLETKKMLLIK